MNLFDILTKYQDAFFNGISVTSKLSIIIWSGGLILGAILGSAGAKWNKAIGIPSWVVSFTLSGIPILVFLFWLHYPLQTILGVIIDPFVTSATALTIINTFSVSDVIRRAILNFPNQFVIAAKVCGLNRKQIFSHIQLPILLRQILPSIIFLQVSMLQATLFASLISVNEIFRVSQNINSLVYRPVEIYTALALLFLVICVPLNLLGYLLEKKFTRDISQN
ncbi:MAG: ABC transporter permease subunit [Ignavibacteriae bacterium]|nr:ABC transporter permease subunit [Ignavibacteriota bacterium]